MNWHLIDRDSNSSKIVILDHSFLIGHTSALKKYFQIELPIGHTGAQKCNFFIEVPLGHTGA